MFTSTPLLLVRCRIIEMAKSINHLRFVLVNERPHLIGTDEHGVVGEFALGLADDRAFGGFEGVDQGREG